MTVGAMQALKEDTSMADAETKGRKVGAATSARESPRPFLDGVFDLIYFC